MKNICLTIDSLTNYCLIQTLNCTFHLIFNELFEMPQTKLYKGTKCLDSSEDFEVAEIPDLVCVTFTTPKS